MNEGPRYISFGDYLRVVRERRVLVILITLLFTGAALSYAIQRKPSYTAETALNYVTPDQQATLFGVPQQASGETPDERAAAASKTVATTDVLERAAKRLKLKGKFAAASLFGRVSARPEAKTNFVIVDAKGSTPEGAVDLANAVAHGAVDVTRDRTRATYRRTARTKAKVLQKLKGPQYFYPRVQLGLDIARLKELARVADPVTIVRPATSASQVGPGSALIVFLGLVVGLTIALVAAFVRDSLDRRYKSSTELTEELGLPTLGFVPERALGRTPINGKRRRVLTQADFEGFRILRTNIEFLNRDDPPRLILVTSALAEEGKSTVATALAVAYALMGKRTLLVESDLRRPTLARRVGVAAHPGLTDYLTENAEPGDVVQVLPWSSLAMNGDGTRHGEGGALAAIAAGTPSSNSSELLSSPRAAAFFEQIKQAYDVVIVDSPPLLAVADTLEVMPSSDAVVVCVRASQTTREQARAAKTALSRLPERPAGIVVTGLRGAEDTGYYHY